MPEQHAAGGAAPAAQPGSGVSAWPSICCVTHGALARGDQGSRKSVGCVVAKPSSGFQVSDNLGSKASRALLKTLKNFNGSPTLYQKLS